MEQTNQCKKCRKPFSTASNLDKHLKKKRDCSSVLKCNKCEKIFKYESDLKKHENRKTMCEPIHGDPTKQTPKNTCHFCYKKLSNTQSIQRHYNICKIKNGGMALLFKEVQRLNERVKQQDEKIKTFGCSKEKMIVNGINQNIETQNITNHNNTTFNFTLINFTEGHDEIIKILTREAPGILGAEQRMDVPMVKQIQDRIIGLVMKVHRNPEQKELQNVYVTDVEKPKDNAFMYDDGNWKIVDWNKLNKNILGNLYTNLDRLNIKSKQDKLEVMKHIFVAGGCGDRYTIESMSDEAVSEMYLEIGNKLNFKTISL
jgi:uncharacterized C2H2 Zn-finger protein